MPNRDEQSRTDALLDKLANKALKDPDFSESDVETLRKVAKVYRGVESLGAFAKIAIAFLVGISGAVTAWGAIAKKVHEWWP